MKPHCILRTIFGYYSLPQFEVTLIVLYCGRVPVANAPRCTAAEGLLYKP